MKKELCRQFNEEVNRFRGSLLFYARMCDWDNFKIVAGRLFDYAESIEISEVERRFFNWFKLILAGLLLIVFLVFKMNPEMYPWIERFKDNLTLIAAAGCCYEIYFFLNFRRYMQMKTFLAKKRRELFINNIEQDFREMTISDAR